MSRTVAVFVLFAGIHGGISAQSVDSLTRRIEALTAEWQTLGRIADEMDRANAYVDSLRRLQVPVDTIQVGYLTVVAEGNAISHVHRAINDAWPRMETAMASATELLSPTTFRVTVTPTQMSEGNRVVPVYPVSVSTEAVRSGADALVRDSAHIDQAVSDALLQAANQQLMSLVPADLHDWAGSVGPSRTSHDLRRSYIDLITSPLTSARACWDRQWDGCRIAMGLVPSSSPLRDWFDADDRRSVVRGADRARDMSRYEAQLYNECVNHGDDISCLALLERWNADPYPLAQMHRQELANTALQLGGNGAYRRLIQTEGALEGRLVAAAGVPLDSVFVAWRRRVDEAVGAPVRATGHTAAMTIIWMLAFLFAATRSTRWRFE